MALRNVVKRGDEILARKCREVTEINDRIITLLDDMIDTMHHDMGVGIAAPQVGVARRICIIEPYEDMMVELINPEILESEGEQLSVEGCLSVPGLIGDVVRPERVVVKYLNREGEEIIEEFVDFEAIVVSHEMDHLDGILYVDKATNVRDAAMDEEE
ncbi:MAG: peptide deformylase [Eubacterium sp.]|nr:peptide deformylase [Eubacterium sp.]